MFHPLLIPLLNTASGAVFDARRTGRRAGCLRPRGAAVPRGVAERVRAVVVLPRADPARARVVVVLRDLPAMGQG
ncbi:hypothetical protein NBRGN_064_00150 [Nocardia brasiliensis NBRC 14402]|uniref:hypothetical protein n=1 Tax=Nocardia brasiliensis TaxID=37326 RepID=UPI0002F28E22|nr:hypothetical protein [Nocardia brasiliensis]GAJ83558.1 hypothetical protein NBRGN_064_00150 [Nocardia brasiliensis NBRC 14402]